MVAPGDPELAADFARRAGSVSHDGEAIYGAQVIAAMEAQAFVESDINKLIDTAVSFIPKDSIIAYMINDIREWHAAEPDWLTEEFGQCDPASVISRNGLSKKFKPCEEALKLFVAVYGAVAGNLALQVMARGGVVIGGGIAPEILPLLKSDLFPEAFHDKGKFRDFMAQIPVKVVVNKRAPLLGAAYFALGENRIQ